MNDSTVTAADLRKHAEMNGLDVDDGLDVAGLLNLLDAAGIAPPEAAAKKPAAKPAKAAKRSAVTNESDLVGKKITVIVADTLHSKDTEFVAVNGRNMLIERGVKSEIPYEFYAMMKEAVGFQYASTEKGGKGAKRNIPTFPMTIVGGDPDVLAFIEANG